MSTGTATTALLTYVIGIVTFLALLGFVHERSGEGFRRGETYLYDGILSLLWPLVLCVLALWLAWEAVLLLFLLLAWNAVLAACALEGLGARLRRMFRKRGKAEYGDCAKCRFLV